MAVSAVIAVADAMVDDSGDGAGGERIGSKSDPSTRWEVVDVQQRLPPRGILLDPLTKLQMGRKMAAKKIARGFPLPRRGPNSRKG